MTTASPAGAPGEFAARLCRWQRRFGRHGLPWQAFRTPYERLVSEVMLQQTQVETVIPYYKRFLERFPTAAALAAAPEDDVLSLWEGLGYYSRARHLQQAAQQVERELGGVFPTTAAGLLALPGVGPSTAAAVAAFTSGEARHPMVDGNVKRVLSRVFLIEGAVGERAFEREVEARAEAELPGSADIADYTQGLMDLGSGVCRRRAPRCAECPMKGFCRAKALGRAEEMPGKKAPPKRRALRLRLLFAASPEGLWLQRRGPGIWRGLWTPLLWEEALPDAASSQPPAGVWEPEAAAASLFGADAGMRCSRALPVFSHDLTHRRLWIEAASVRLSRTDAAALQALSPCRPFPFEGSEALPAMPKPVKSAFQALLPALLGR